MILIEAILCEVFKGGLPAFHSFKLLILGKLVLINPLFSIELQNWDSKFIWVPVLHLLIQVKVELLRFLLGYNCEIFLIVPLIIQLVIRWIYVFANWVLSVLIFSWIHFNSIFSCHSDCIFAELRVFILFSFTIDVLLWFDFWLMFVLKFIAFLTEFWYVAFFLLCWPDYLWSSLLFRGFADFFLVKGHFISANLNFKVFLIRCFGQCASCRHFGAEIDVILTGNIFSLIIGLNANI